MICSISVSLATLASCWIISFEAVGAGDAFGAGLIHAMLHDFEPQKAIDFAISASV